MIPLNVALAAVLLTSSAEPPDDLSPFYACRPAVARLALAWEILDPQETRYLLTWAPDLGPDLALLRRRRVELADAPPLYDCMRFPDRDCLNAALAFNRAYQRHLADREALELWHAWELHQTRMDAARLYAVLDLARDTRCDYYYVAVRRRALKQLRATLGDEAYYSGRLPPIVPLWAMERADP